MTPDADGQAVHKVHIEVVREFVADDRSEDDYVDNVVDTLEFR